MAEITVPIHALRVGDRFLDDAGTTVTKAPVTGSDLPQGYVEVGLSVGGATRFFGDVQIAVDRR